MGGWSELRGDLLMDFAVSRGGVEGGGLELLPLPSSSSMTIPSSSSASAIRLASVESDSPPDAWARDVIEWVVGEMKGKGGMEETTGRVADELKGGTEEVEVWRALRGLRGGLRVDTGVAPPRGEVSCAEVKT